MFLMQISVTFLLLIIIQDAQGSKEGILINDGEDDSKINGSSHSIPGTQDGSFANKSSSGNNCGENDFHHELVNLTSNSQINIITDVMLLSFVSLVGLEDIAIIGYDNPTINCNNAGGIYFENCTNFTITGLTWENCGIKNDSKPVIELHISSDIIIQNCTFQHSVTQALVFSEVFGNITINNCMFAFNNNSISHGTALYYVSKIQQKSKFQFIIISNCNFIENGINSRSVVYISSSNNKSVEQMIFTNISFLNNQAVPIYISHQDVHAIGNILFEGNVADESGGIFITNNSNVVFYNADLKFSNNQALNNGGALHIKNNCDLTFKGNCTVMIEGNKATSGGGLYVSNNSVVTFEGNSLITINSSIVTKYGGGLSVLYNSKVNFIGNCEVNIKNSEAIHGGAVYIEDNSDVMFEGNPEAVISNNLAERGGAIYIKDISNVVFKGNSTATVVNNRVTHNAGAFHALDYSNISFKENSMVVFDSNHGVLYGGGIFIRHYSNVVYEGNSIVAIKNNQAEYGGGIYIGNISNITFKGNSIVTIDNNEATLDGGGLYVWNYGFVLFEENATVSFKNNRAKHNGGALCFCRYDNIKFKEDAHVTFYNNSASNHGGALFCRDNCNFTMKGNSTTIFNNNEALGYGGAVYLNLESTIRFQGNSMLEFNNNKASNYAGSLYFRQNCEALFEESTLVKFSNNMVDGNGGALYAWDNCSFLIKGNSTVICKNNRALSDGGGLYINTNSAIKFQENSTVNFSNNTANSFGGALRSNSHITFENNCRVIFNHSKATQGGAIFAVSDTVFQDKSTVQFDNNKADTLGGALHVSNLTFNGNIIVNFNNNEAGYGGGLFSHNSIITMKKTSTMTFISNSADNGGAIFISASILLITEHTNVTFLNNTAEKDGGAIYFDEHTNVLFENSSLTTLTSNTADNHGGAIYTKITQTTKFFNLSVTNFSNNTAGMAGNSLYIDVVMSCNDSCFADRVAEMNLSDKEIITSPSKIQLHYPAKSINNDNAEYEKYYMNNIMLGQEIKINPCVLDYHEMPAEVTQFQIIGENHDKYLIHGSEYASVSCNHTIKGISIVGNKPISSLPLNYSILFTSYATHKPISTNLVVELSPCHPGFHYQSESKKCECYNNSEIVYCSGSSSTIKRGYWFGSVTGIPTVTLCPINYCNFTCCKTTNAYYELSPVRVNQCRSHRSGTACGSCKEGYTLSFDSPECIDVAKCTTGQRALIITLTVLYWFIIIVAVFIIMYYQVGIGYFYAITYYYSVMDILFDQYMDTSDILYGTITIFSSMAKLTPQFLGHLCLMKNISGIDQQFIHYVHPLVVSAILIMVSWSAKIPKRFSVIVSRGIVRALCFLLLLSYTSLVTTSLLLMRSLTFDDVANIYTYLSPEIQYFHDRHLAYGIIAIIFTLLIVIALPLILLLEPFLNTKINFLKVKPLLSKFQECYKEKYQWFAAYYMICRLIIISIIFANLSAVFFSQFLLITASTIIALIHLIVRPYADDFLNMFDGVTLQLMVLVTVLPLFEYVDTFDSGLVVATALLLMILPLVHFTVVKAFTSKQTLKVITKKVIAKFSFQNNAIHKEVHVADNLSTDFVDLTIDDSVRKNATIVVM